MAEPSGLSFETLRNIYGITEYSAAVLNLSLHSLVIYLVLTKTPSEMKIYGRLVLNQTVSEMLLITVGNLLMQPVLLYPTNAAVICGPLGLFGHSGFMLAAILLLLLIGQCIISVTVCFAYRYRKLLNNPNASWCSNRMMGAALALWYSMQALLFFFILKFGNETVSITWQDILAQYPRWSVVPADRVVIAQPSQWAFVIGVFAIALAAVNCVVDVAFYWLIKLKLAAIKLQLRGKTYTMHKSLTLGLLIQVISPIACILVPALIYHPLRLISGTEIGIVFLVNSLSYYHLVSALATLYFIRPYRKAVADCLRILIRPLIGPGPTKQALQQIPKITIVPVQ